jgi:membrane protease subunit HflK
MPGPSLNIPAPKPGKILQIAAGAVALILLAIAAFDSWFVLDAKLGEQAVLQRFGRFKTEVTEPGFHFKMPFGIDTVTVARVQEVRRVEIGFRSTDISERDHPESGPSSVAESEHSIAITKDQNLVDADYVVQYEISSLKDFLFNVSFPDWTVRQAAKATMREIIANRNIDDILTTGRDEMQAEAKEQIQKILDGYKMGVRIKSVQFQDVHAPDEVIPAFNDVQKAKEERETALNEGLRYTNAVIPKAEGLAQKHITEAEAYKIRRINEATGDASRFTAIYEAYKKSPDLTRTTLYLQMMAEVLPGLEKTLIDGDQGSFLLPLTPGKDRR